MKTKMFSLVMLAFGLVLPQLSLAECSMRRKCPDGGIVSCTRSGSPSYCGVWDNNQFAYCQKGDHLEGDVTYICCSSSGGTVEVTSKEDAQKQCKDAGKDVNNSDADSDLNYSSAEPRGIYLGL